jgi:hypothetical protein
VATTQTVSSAEHFFWSWAVGVIPAAQFLIDYRLPLLLEASMKVRLYIFLMVVGFIVICSQVFSLQLNPLIFYAGFIVEFCAVIALYEHVGSYERDPEFAHRWWDD